MAIGMMMKRCLIPKPLLTIVWRYPFRFIRCCFFNEHCPICHGEGKVTEEEKIRVEDRMKSKRSAKTAVGRVSVAVYGVAKALQRKPGSSAGRGTACFFISFLERYSS